MFIDSKQLCSIINYINSEGRPSQIAILNGLYLRNNENEDVELFNKTAPINIILKISSTHNYLLTIIRYVLWNEMFMFIVFLIQLPYYELI